MPTRLVLSLLLIATTCASTARGQSPDVVRRWPVEQVVTKEGKTYRGLIHAEQDGEIEFIEVVQPRGRPMYLVVRPIDVEDVASKKRLPEDQRELLQRRVQAFRFRSRIEAGRMDRVELLDREDSGREYLRFSGPWFTLDSTADDETTRRCVVRIVQIFRAYRQMLPPRVEPQRVEPRRPLRVLLFASMDEYRAFLTEHGLDITNPAVYSQRGNIVVAASELTRYARRLEATRAQHAAIRAEYETLDKDLSKRLAALRKQLADAGVDENAIKAEDTARRVQWQAEMAERMLQLNAADRRNERRFDEVTDAMFRRLYHEAFHAYLENYLYPGDEHDVPIWLHEGLAQLFQSGQLEADTLRVDAPLPSALRAVQADMRSDQSLPLATLLAAQRSDFLATGEDDAQAQRLYNGAWALVYYLAFYQGVLGTPALDDFVAKDIQPDEDDDARAITRFQELTEQPLVEFEVQWRAAMLALKPPR